MSTDESFTRLAGFIEDEMDFATSHYNDSYLQRRLASRMRRTGSDDYDEYLEVLRADTDEREALLDALSINVTGFFRNEDVWEGIRSVLRELSAEKEQIHAWSAACADGREPYSLAMLAHDDPRTDEEKLNVLATDINDKALRSARAGVYETTRTIDIQEQLNFLSNFHRFVEQQDTMFSVRDQIQRHVTFEHHDLINDQPKAGFDLVICRNLFIYIDSEYKQPILETLTESIRPGGYLVIGKAETIPPNLKGAFEVLDGRLRIYRRD
ncbi:protein-glutamate O-methyltransferase CheR [Halostella sp. PRR32]|uniref:CheR family methyltransferase n=1 Tax=Halostella sp. PRR32 TaxID=3098147 RepID=UPI002B1DB698|nr:protein-glutamate O-methyltransferase CheR [Halostella sp. PRR32]